VSSFTLATVGNIVDGDGRHKQAILDRDPLSCIGPLLSSPDSDVRERACWAIATIVSESLVQLGKVFEYNLVPRLVQCLADADPYARDSAARAVNYIASDGTHEQTRCLVQEGCIRPLCDLLAAEDASTALVAVDCIEYILLAGDGTADRRRNGVGTNKMAATVSEAGGVAKMKDLLAHRSPNDEHDFWEAAEAAEVAARVLKTYFGEVDDGIAGAAAAGGPSGQAGGDGREPPRQRRRRT
jgi:importin subunit alpha-6/7